jgi:fumarate hydratase class II
MADYRIEHDSFGEVRVPASALYGAQTQRALENFPISGIRFPRVFIRAIGLIKAAAAEVNMELGLLDAERAQAIVQAAQEVAHGDWDDHFPLDVFQTGSGTSTNMNANEVIAHRASQILKGDPGSNLVHPNDHVNMGQSSNDVIPTAIHLAAFLQVHELLLPALRYLHLTLERRIAEFENVVKTGRTHLMDATPIRLSQEMSGWAYQVVQGVERIESCLPRLGKLALGGTAVGTGINTHPEFAGRVAAKLAARTGLPLVETEHHFAAQSAMDTAVELSGHLKTTASALMKVANDLRWMNSGPLAGLGEISLPALQPGSSIMPGKVNPVICEAMMMVCAQVIGNDLAVTTGNAHGNFELNVMLPLIAHNLLQSITILGNAARGLADNAVAGFTVNRERMADVIEKNPILVTALNPIIGYDRAAQIAKRAYAEGRRVKEVAAEMTDLSPEELERLLDPRLLTEGGIGKSR